MIEAQIAFITKAKHSSKEEFLEKYSTNSNIWELLQDAKEGFIQIEKISNNIGFLSKGEVQRGWTPAFGVGLSCYIDNVDSYYYTSVIESINWKDGTFNTMNSTYKFKLDESKSKEA